MDESARGGSISQWDGYVEQIRQQLPPAPEGLLNFYVTWIPWVGIVFGAISLFFTVIIGLVLALVMPFLALGGASAISGGFGAVIAWLLAVAYSVLAIVGAYWMLKRRLTGWWVLAVGLVVGILSNLVHLSILGLIIDLLIGYIHVQVKPRYS